MKIKVLDTNTILEHSLQTIVDTLDRDGGAQIVIPFSVIVELDTFKVGSENRNYNCRRSIGLIEELRKKCKRTGERIDKAVVVSDHCLFQIFVTEEDKKLREDKVDNDIILTSLIYQHEYDEVEILTMDLHERIIADCLNIDSGSLEEDTDLNIDTIYNGIEKIKITDKQLQEFYSSYSNQCFLSRRVFPANQFLEMEDGIGGEHLGIYKADSRKICGLSKKCEAWGITPKKGHGGEAIKEQAMLMHLLLDPTIQFVSVIGPSGTGKTLLALACALEQTLNKDFYKKILIMRPLANIDKDIGALPGDKLEKLEPWMGSSFDNLEFLFNKKQAVQTGTNVSPRETIYALIEAGYIELEALQYIRGRSIPNQFIIVDDAQNLTSHQAATIITRAGEGTKIVFLGDISKKQIDNPRLNSANNGLTYVVDKFKGKDDIIGHVSLNEVVRSKLASIGVELL